jgi:hypothetical protein
MNDKEITMEIVLELIEQKSIQIPVPSIYGDPNSYDTLVKYNADFVQEVCKAFEAVYQTVSKLSNR